MERFQLYRRKSIGVGEKIMIAYRMLNGGNK